MKEVRKFEKNTLFGTWIATKRHEGWSVKITDSFIFDMFYTSFCLFSVCTPVHVSTHVRPDHPLFVLSLRIFTNL